VTFVVNVFGGPGAGKSTFAAGLFCRLKRNHLECELVTEVAKQRIWEGRGHALRNQISILGKQWELIETLLGKVEVVVCDSPVLLCSVYAPAEYPQSFHDLALWAHEAVPSLNVLLNRPAASYQESGRIQSLSQALEADRRVAELIVGKGLPHTVADNDESGMDLVEKAVMACRLAEAGAVPAGP
jgi:hypothetical protein